MNGSKRLCHQIEKGTITCPTNNCEAMNTAIWRYPGALPVLGSTYQGSSPGSYRGLGLMRFLPDVGDDVVVFVVLLSLLSVVARATVVAGARPWKMTVGCFLRVA